MHVPIVFDSSFSELRSVILRHHDACTGCDTHEQHQHQVQNRSRASDCRQRIVSDKPSDNDAVDGVIKLLGHISYQHRYGKNHNGFYRIIFCHIYRLKQFHIKPPKCFPIIYFSAWI